MSFYIPIEDDNLNVHPIDQVNMNEEGINPNSMKDNDTYNSSSKVYNPPIDDV